MIWKNRNTRSMFLILILIVCISGAIPLPALAQGVPLPDGGTVSDDIPGATGGLSTAKHFHIFSNKAVLDTHTNGNIATGILVGNVNFGTNVQNGLLSKDIHYLKAVETIASSSFVTSTESRALKVVFGSEVQVSLAGDKLAVNGTELHHVKFTQDPATNEAFVDTRGQLYIDFEAVFAELRDTSHAFAKRVDTLGIRKNFEDRNNRFVDVSEASISGKGSVYLSKTNESGDPLPGVTFDLYKGDMKIKSGLTTDQDGKIAILNELDIGNYSFRETEAPSGYQKSDEPVKFSITQANLDTGGLGGYIYLSLTKDELESDTPIKILGLKKGGPSVIINVDMGSSDSVNIRSKIIPVIDGEERANKETEDFSDAKLLWNFPTDTRNIYVNAPFQGTILATGASVEANQNVDGSIIANHVHIKDSESHRWDFQESSASTSQPVQVSATNQRVATGSWVPTVTKTLTGRALTDDQFEFELKEGDKLLQSVKNKADGSIPFEPINYTLDDVGAHTYTITEKAGSLPGVSYDSLEVTYTVEVSDQGDGTLKAEVTTPPTDTQFDNTYTSPAPTPTPVPTTPTYRPIHVPLSATKILHGGTLKEGQFTFELLGGDKNGLRRQATMLPVWYTSRIAVSARPEPSSTPSAK